MPTNPSGYDTALICEAGHVATSLASYASDAPEYCPTCGRPVLAACPHCEAPIRGAYSGGFYTGGYDRPAYCIRCGGAFPWQAAAIRAAQEVADEITGLDPEERERLKEALEDISTDSPRTELGASRVRSVVERLKGPTGQLLYKAAETIATEGAKAIMRGGI
ncbi:MAG: DUF2321 domain-containing protein [Chloroflexota bacterium]